jgi:hypothetical protein
VLTALGIAIALACIVASAERLKRAVLATPIDPALLVEALQGDAGRARFEDVRASLKQEPEGTWERELAEAFDQPQELRDGVVNELMSDLDFRLQSWARVPRTCARVAALSGLVLGALALREGLTVSEDLPYEVRQLAIGHAVWAAINVVAIGISGTIVCIALAHTATKAAKVRQREVDRLVERLETLAEAVAENQENQN